MKPLGIRIETWVWHMEFLGDLYKSLRVLKVVCAEASIEFYSHKEGKILCFPLDLGYLYVYEDGTCHKSNYNPVEYCDYLDQGKFSKGEINCLTGSKVR